jgi:hypothetical protein
MLHLRLNSGILSGMGYPSGKKYPRGCGYGTKSLPVCECGCGWLVPVEYVPVAILTPTCRGTTGKIPLSQRLAGSLWRLLAPFPSVVPCRCCRTAACHYRLLTVDYCIKVRLDLQADKSSIVVKGPFFP